MHKLFFFACSEYDTSLKNYITSDAEEEFRWLQEGIKYQSAFCANMIGRGYEKGWWGLPIDKNKAIEYFLMSIDFEENGEPDEGWAYYNYALNCKDNVQRKISFLEKAATNRYKHSSAAYELGDMYFSGNEIERDYKKAYSYFKLGSEWGNDASTFMLGRCIYEGKGVEKNLRTGFDYMSKGATNPHYLSIARDYARQYVVDLAHYSTSDVLSAYFGNDGLFFVTGEERTAPGIFKTGMKNHYGFYYLSFDEIHNTEEDRCFEILDVLEVEAFRNAIAIIGYADQAIYIVVGNDNTEGALYTVEDVNHRSLNFHRISTFNLNTQDGGIFFDFDEKPGVICYGSRGYSELEYAYR